MTNRENNGKGKEPKTTPVPTSPEVQGASADVKPEFPVVGTDNSNPGGSINEIRRGAALLQLGALQSAIFNNPNFSSIVTDEKGVIQIYNVGADRLLGYKADEVVNKATPADLTDPQELSERAKSLSAEHGTPIAPGFEALAFKASRGIDDQCAITFVRKDGSRIPMVASVTALRNRQGAIIGYLLLGTNDTESMRVEELLRAGEEKYRNLFNNAEVGIFRLRLDWSEILEVNHRFLEIVGMTIEETLGKPSVNLWADPKEREEMSKRLAADGSVHGFECKLLNKRRGDVRNCLTSMRIYPEKGVLEGTILDITERKLAEQTQMRLAAMLDATPGFVGFADAKDTHILYINPAGRKIVGIQAQEDVTRLKIADVHPEWTNKLFRDEIIPSALRDGMWTGECAFLNRDGREIPVMMVLLVHNSPSGEVERFSTISIDITDRKRAERALRESEERYRELFENAKDIIFTYDLAGNFTSINKAAEQAIGYTLDEALKMNISSVLAPEYVDGFRQAMSREESERVQTQYELEIVRKDGRRVPLEASTRVIYSCGKPVGVQGIARNITDRKRAEEEINVLAKFPSENPDPVMRISAGGTLLYINESGSGQLSEWNLQVGKIAPPLLKDAVSRALNDGSREMLDLEYGESAYSFSVSPVQDAGYANLYARNITDHKRAEAEKEKLQAQLHQAQKMEAVGRLAGGVAHDFNNLLTVITGYSEILLQKIGKESPMHGEVEEIRRAGERAASLTQQLLAFSRKQVIEPKVLDLSLLMDNLGKMLVRLLGENIHLKIVPGKDLGLVKIDPGQFDQVLINLAVNARDAMPDGGTLLIETANVELDEEYCAQHPYQILPGWYVRLAVSDTGHGMAEKTRQQIFEPFFTTKEKGKGTGLGLSMVYGAVKQAGGSIEAYSEVGIGTTFKIYLPRVEGDAMKPGEDERSAVLPEGTETVLVVEDDDTVRNLGVRILERFGYKVMQARNGDEAISLAAGYGERIDLLLTDVVMPGMNGSELATQLVLHHPEMEVLFTSGYTDDTITRHGVLDEGVSFLGKPYTPSALAKKVREVLDRA